MPQKCKIWVIIFCLISSTSLYAQNSSKPIPISVSYFGQFAYQPGLKVGTEFPLMGQTGSENFKKQWFGNPQIAFFTNPGSDSNYLVNFEVGIRKQTNDKNSYSAFSIGLGYLLQSRIESFSVNLGTGDRSNKIRSSQRFILPTVSYEKGWGTHKQMSWYSKLSVGSSLFGEEDQFMLFAEFGVKFKINKKSKVRTNE